MSAFNPSQIVQNVSQIGHGFQLSNNFMLEHMTTGAFNKILGKWVPQFPQQLVPWLPNGIFSQGFPLLQLVQNLQNMSGNIMEQMLSAAGSQMNIMAGFIASNDPNKLTDGNPFGMIRQEANDLAPLIAIDPVAIAGSLVTQTTGSSLAGSIVTNTIDAVTNNPHVLFDSGGAILTPTIPIVSRQLTSDESDIDPIRPLVNETGHTTGTSVDIAIQGFSNPIYIAKDIQKICVNASSIVMVYGRSGSHFHINFDPNKPSGNGELPLIKSVDLVTGESMLGIIPFRGFA